MKRLSWFVLFSILAVSCLDQPDCYQLNNNIALVTFKILGGGNDAVLLNKVTSPGAGMIFQDSLVSSTGIGLPLNPYSNEGSFTFDASYLYGPVVQTLNLTYLARVQFVSEDCGERHVFTDIVSPSNDFDSVLVVNTVPANPPRTNIELYRCPVTNVLNVDFVADAVVKTVYVRELDETVTIGASTGGVLLPLAPSEKQTTYEFTYGDNTTRMLTVSYERTTRKMFEPCGEQTFFGEINYVAGSTNFATVTVKEKSTHDLPNKVNLEVAP